MIKKLAKHYPKAADPLVERINQVAAVIRQKQLTVAPDSIAYIRYVMIESDLRAAAIRYIEGWGFWMEQLLDAKHLTLTFGFDIPGLIELVDDQIQVKGSVDNE